MLHACFYTICLVFRYTSWRFYAFFRTNLLTRCHSASSLFSTVLCFRKVTQEIFSELDKTKAKHPEIDRSFQRTEEETKWGHEGPTQQGSTAQGHAAPPMCVAASFHFWRCTFTYKDPRREKPKHPIPFPETHRRSVTPMCVTSRSAAVIDPRSGGSRSSFRHPAEEGNHHRRSFLSPCLPPPRWVSSLPWTMGP
jgi:hypothetical protein